MKIVPLFILLVSTIAHAAEVKRITPADFTGAKQPQAAVTEDGATYVAFGKESSIYVTRADAGDESPTEPVKVAELNKLALGMRRGPRIAVAGSDVVLTAISHGDGNLHSWRSVDSGKTWSRATMVNSVTNAAREGLHALAGDGKSKLFSVWLDLRNGKTELWSSVSNDGGERWEENRRVYKSPSGSICECCHPSVVINENGEIVVMWRNSVNGERDMYQCVSSDGGKSFSAAKKIGSGTWKLNGCPMDGGSVAANGEKVAYGWRRESRLFVTGNDRLSKETVFNETGTQPVVVVNGDGFSYLWQDGGHLYIKRTGSGPAEVLAKNAGYAASAWKAGKAVVVWEGADGIYMTDGGRAR